MKKFFIVQFLIYVSICNGQSIDKPSVEDNVFGFQTGLSGLWVHYEKKLTNPISLRTELGLDFGFRQGIFTNNEFIFAFAPNISLEPRWYYSQKRRLRKERPIDNNSGSLLALKLHYFPDLFVISNSKDISIEDSISIIPKYGFRKVWNNNLTFETGIGIGAIYFFEPQFWDTTAELTVRIGWNF